MADPVLAIDLGGTKVLAGAVSAEGKILFSVKESVQTDGGPEVLIKQITQLSEQVLKKYPEIKKAALSSAGPLDPEKGLWLNLTNLDSKGKKWGKVPVIQKLQDVTSIEWKLENDAAAAIRAEVWMGRAKGLKNAIALTLGTGLGVGVWANGNLVRAGRGLHPEAGHIIIEHQTNEVLCGCGNYGCAEAYLSGVNFTRWVSKRWSETGMGSVASGEELVNLARGGDSKAVDLFVEYGQRLAIYLASLVVLFCPEKFVISGGFSHASDLFLPHCQKKLAILLASRRDGIDLMPLVEVSNFQETAGLLGAAHTIISPEPH